MTENDTFFLEYRKVSAIFFKLTFNKDEVKSIFIMHALYSYDIYIYIHTAIYTYT